MDRTKNFKICVVCGKRFQCPPSDKTLTCSKDCSIINKSLTHKGKTRTQVTKDRMSATAKKKGLTENLKRGTPTIKQSPLLGRFETNIYAKEWVLKSPEGKVYKCRNLNHWVRSNCELFGKETSEKSVVQISNGIRSAKRGTEGKITAPTCTYKGWIVVIE